MFQLSTIAFHFNAHDKLGYACRLLRKAHANGATVAVIAEPALLALLDTELWSFSALDFIPHGQAQALQTHEAAATPILLCTTSEQGQGRDVLLNLGSQVPIGYKAFSRVIELVGSEETDRSAARVRWKHYVSQGLQPERHDVSTGETT